MQSNSDFPGDFSIQDAMRLAQSDSGKQLFAILQQTDGGTLRSAMAQAEAGDYDKVKQTLSSLLSNPEIQSLLEQMGRQ